MYDALIMVTETGFDVSPARSVVEMTLFWVLTPRCFVIVYRHFSEICCHHLPDRQNYAQTDSKDDRWTTEGKKYAHERKYEKGKGKNATTKDENKKWAPNKAAIRERAGTKYGWWLPLFRQPLWRMTLRRDSLQTDVKGRTFQLLLSVCIVFLRC